MNQELSSALLSLPSRRQGKNIYQPLVQTECLFPIIGLSSWSHPLTCRSDEWEWGGFLSNPT